MSGGETSKGSEDGQPKGPSVASWIKLPEDGLYGQWHLEAPPTIRGEHVTRITHSACGRSFVPSEPTRIERTESIDGVPEAERCPACQVHASETRGGV